ncbi:hypothetical protein Tco_1193594, partial [Tanacetum coccineum]
SWLFGIRKSRVCCEYIAPRYAGIVMGVSNTAGTLAGIIGVRLKGQLLEAAKAIDSDLSSPDS